MAGPKDVLRWDTFRKGIYEATGLDSTKIDPESVAVGRNVIVDDAGSLKQRLGLKKTKAGVPSAGPGLNQGFRLFEFAQGTFGRLLATDGGSWRAYNEVTDVWTNIGNWISQNIFPPTGALVGGRLYVVNNSARMECIEWTGAAFTIRQAGVNLPGVAWPLQFIDAIGGNPALPKKSFRVTITEENVLTGFESNANNYLLSAVDTWFITCNDGASIRLRNVGVGAGTKVYSSLNNLSTPYFVARGQQLPIDGATGARYINTLDISRDEGQPLSWDHNVPPSDMAYLKYWRGRLYGAQYRDILNVKQMTHYRFSGLDTPEYWPLTNFEDVAYDDNSPLVAFSENSLGLLLHKNKSTLLLDRDPSLGGSARPFLDHGLINPFAVVSGNGVSMWVTERGPVIHDGVRLIEVWRRLADISKDIVSAATYSPTASYAYIRPLVEGQFISLYYIPNKSDGSTYVHRLSYDTGRGMICHAVLRTDFDTPPYPLIPDVISVSKIDSIRGKFLWNKNGGYEIDRTAGVSPTDIYLDATKDVECVVRTQEKRLGDVASDVTRGELDIESGVTQTQVEVTTITDGTRGPTRTVAVKMGREEREEFPTSDKATGDRHAVEVRWTEPTIRLHGVRLFAERRGRGMP